MKIIIVGASGTIGRKVTAALEGQHELIKVGSKSGDIQIDMTSPASIEEMFKKVGSFDAVISAAGSGHWGPLEGINDEAFRKGLNYKLMGQVNLVLIGQHLINPGGSFTLTSGILSEDPVVGGAAVSAVNAAINSFALAAAIELKNDVRINAVSPGVVEDSPEIFPAFPGHIPVTMEKVVAAYLKSVLGSMTGQVIKAF
ncbi:MAG: short-chain dehydrogenase/reductase [Segetibacter sp.]|nr:short-chain dehydrogenase/reductase [Segetibacter sp.]